MRKSELILNPDGSIYHLHLLPQDIAQTIILVGDPDRVPMVSSFFDSIEVRKQKREFVTHTGQLNNLKITAISTGIGTDNIDIVMNELDALWCLDLQTGEVLPNKSPLTFIRIGTSGAIHPNIDVDSFLLSEKAIGLDGLLRFYDLKNKESNQIIDLKKQLPELTSLFYESWASQDLLQLFDFKVKVGTTATLPGFYAPQGRQLRLLPTYPNLLEILRQNQVDNFEMETAAIYALASALEHKALSFNAILANRELGTFSTNPKQTVTNLIEFVLNGLSSFS